VESQRSEQARLCAAAAAPPHADAVCARRHGIAASRNGARSGAAKQSSGHLALAASCTPKRAPDERAYVVELPLPRERCFVSGPDQCSRLRTASEGHGVVAAKRTTQHPAACDGHRRRLGNHMQASRSGQLSCPASCASDVEGEYCAERCMHGDAAVLQQGALRERPCRRQAGGRDADAEAACEMARHSGTNCLTGSSNSALCLGTPHGHSICNSQRCSLERQPMKEGLPDRSSTIRSVERLHPERRGRRGGSLKLACSG
jgi:hypothetical protein